MVDVKASRIAQSAPSVTILNVFHDHIAPNSKRVSVGRMAPDNIYAEKRAVGFLYEFTHKDH